jgi:transposase InsO family protein
MNLWQSQITKNLPPRQKASRGRVARLMRVNGIRSKVVKKYKATTNSNHNLPVAENLVNQNFEASKPNEKWLSDITYIPTEEGWLYLAGVLGFICSMSRKGNCYDNALMESFWGKLKMEWLNERAFKTRAEAKKAVFEYIELFYNRRRTHSSNDYVPPFKLGVAI